jgi:hypothetical protein
MPHGNHPDWLAFVAMAADPNDTWGKRETNAYEFQRLWETGTFEQVWDAITPRARGWDVRE